MLAVDCDKNEFLFQWPESQRLKTALEQKKTGICYTMPGLKTDAKFPAKDTEKYHLFFNNHFCKISPDLNGKGLSALLTANQVEIALNATTVLLSQMGQGLNKIGRTSATNEQTLMLWSLRFQLLLVLKMHKQVVEEIAAFEELDAPDLYYQYHLDSNKKGTMVPFSLRLIHAEILRFTPLPWKALERTEKLKANIQSVLDIFSQNKVEEAVSAWKRRLIVVEKIHARLLFSLGEVRQSMIHLDCLRKISSAEDQGLLTLEMLRIALFAGDDSTSNKLMLEASSKSTQPNHLTLHKALRALFLGAFPHTGEYAQRLIKAEDKRAMVTNLAAINSLYTGKVNDGVKLLSEYGKPLPEHLVTNIRSMSELGLPAAQKDTLMREIEL